ncbi:phosphatidylserine decarboxylase [Sulfurimonas sp.]|nr:phosphatidylserine decarboxylase [Sulfurimonas sp.]
MSRHITSAISQTFGKFANREFSRPVQNFINNGYVKLMGLDMSEFNSPESYRSLNALFTRSLSKDRVFSKDAQDFISPCDSWISECGELDKEYALQIKGMSYTCDDFIGSEFTQDEKNLVHNGTFVNFYLSPKDYHRYHIPCDLKVLKAVHVPGKFYPVNVPSLNKRVNLFIENERVVMLCETESKQRFYMILVSALNVGVMQVSFEPNIKTNINAESSTSFSYENLELKKGDDFGCFEMGSTIVILAEKDFFELHVEMGDNVKYGDTIAKVK